MHLAFTLAKLWEMGRQINLDTKKLLPVRASIFSQKFQLPSFPLKKKKNGSEKETVSEEALDWISSSEQLIGLTLAPPLVPNQKQSSFRIAAVRGSDWRLKWKGGRPGASVAGRVLGNRIKTAFRFSKEPQFNYEGCLEWT